MVYRKAPLWTRQTPREKLGTVDGLNLFFGALLGANLGTLDGLSISEYSKLILLLAVLVVTIRVVSTSERRVYALATLAIYLVIFAVVLFVPSIQPQGMAEADLHRLGATIAIWVGATMLVEFYPTTPPEKS